MSDTFDDICRELSADLAAAVEAQTEPALHPKKRTGGGLASIAAHIQKEFSKVHDDLARNLRQVVCNVEVAHKPVKAERSLAEKAERILRGCEHSHRHTLTRRHLPHGVRCYWVVPPVEDADTLIKQAMQGHSPNKVTGPQNPTAGVMIRETLAANSTFAYAFYSKTNAGIYGLFRTTTGGSASWSNQTAATLPYWVKVVRSGSTFSSYLALDGVNWVQVGTSQTINMAQNVYVGLATTNGSTANLATATFDSVSVSSASAPAPVITGVSATTGAIGNQVTITGTNFGATQGGSQVLLNKLPMTVNSWTSASILITISSGATSGSLLVAVAPTMNNSNPVTFAVTSQPLTMGWLDQDVGAVGTAGSATYSNGVFTVKGAGAGISAASDGFHFVYQPLAGDGAIVARVTSLQGNGYQTAGVMIRETLAANSTLAYTDKTASYVYFSYRTTTGASLASSNPLTPSLPYWIKVVRSGNVFASFVAMEGVNWVQLGTSQTISMAQNVYVGLAVTNGNTSTLATATFDSVSVSSATNPGPVITGVSATTASVGSQVTIYGTGFGASQGGSSATLNNTPLTINSWTDTSIAATIPAGATSGYLLVTVAPTMNNSNPVTFAVTSQPLTMGWLDQDVGAVGTAGSATYSNGIFTVKGAGAGISAASDGFHFVYQPLAGDGAIVARVTSLQGNGYQTAGVMIRETLAANSTLAYTDKTAPYVYFSYRTTTGASLASSNPLTPSLPYWIKVVRSGNVFASFVAMEGVNWVQLGTSQTISMAQNVYVGLAVTNGNTSTLATATFDSVSVSSTTVLAPVITGISATTGAIGNQVTITGTGFGATQGGSQVLLNNSPMTVNSWTSTSIVMTIAAGATSGSLLVSVAPTMNDSNPVPFTVTTQPLLTPWLDQDVGTVGLAGSANYANGVYTIQGAGVGLSSTADAFHFVYLSLSGDGAIVARLTTLPTAGSSVGLMMRETLDRGARTVALAYAKNSAYFSLNERTAPGATIASQNGAYQTTLPYWMKLVRSGNTFSGYVSADGVNWVQASTTQTVPMNQSIYVGLAVASGSTTTVATATLDGLSVATDILVPPSITGISTTTGSIGSQITVYGTGFGSTQSGSAVLLNGLAVTINSWAATTIVFTIPVGATTGPLEVLLAPSMNSSNPVMFQVTSQPLPSGWFDQDVGTVGLFGSATYLSGTFTVNGAGLGLTGTADGINFAYKPQYGDGVFIARLTGLPTSGSEAGLTLRESLDPGAKNVSLMYLKNSAYFMMYERTASGGSTSSQYGVYQTTLPYWMKLVRAGNSFSGFVSADGVNWVQAGTTQTVSMAQSLYLGFVGSSTRTTSVTAATFDNVSVASGTMPTISAITPTAGGIGASVTINGTNFGNSQGTSSVNFNGVTAGSTTSWNNTQIVAVVPANATSGPVTVVVGGIQSNTNFSYTVYHPNITGISPGTAQVGATVAVNGSGFGAGQGTSQVNFNGAAAGVSNWSDTSITVTVPTAATSGPVTVVVGGVTSNSVQFSVESLSITSISPTSGPAGSLVAINGSGFGATQSTGTVDFFGATAAVQSWSDTQIVAVVPAGAWTGYVDVTVGSITWYGPQFVVTMSTQLTDSQNHQSNYATALIGGMWHPTVTQGSGCSTCSHRGNVSFIYDSNGNALSRTDENGNTTTYTYDSNGNVLTITVPISPGHVATTTYTYNSFGEVLTVADPMGFVTTNTFDSKGNLLTVTTPAPGNGASASVTRFTYNTVGELTRITDPLGNQTNIAYFPSGLIQTITDVQSNVTTYAYDNRGNRTSVTDANNKQTTFTYDSMNRLTLITYPDSTTTQFGYDYRGRRTSVTDQNGKATSYAYDDADRLITVTDAANNVTTYGYDSESNLTSIKDASNNTTAFDYDVFGRVTTTHFPSGQIEQYGYDNVGNLTSKTDRKNQLITYTYDQLNRLAQKSYPDSSTVNYTYDNDSRLTQVTDPTGTYSFTFDNMGRLTGTTSNYAFLSGRSFTTSYGYDAASNRTSLVDPENGSTSYAYDTLNRLQTLTPPAAISGGSFGFGYDALSRRTSLTRPNSVNTSYGYDNLSRLLSVTHAKSGTTLDGATYTVDNAGNRLTRTPQPTGTGSTFGYDNIYELLSVTQNGSTTESYTYDPVGNRLTSLAGSWSNNTSNELTASPTASYTYDANGNTQTKTDSTGTTTYSWDYDNRLTQVTLPGSAGTVSFRYDPLGRRIYKSSSAGTSIYAYDGLKLVQEANSSGSAVARYSLGLNIDEPLAELRSGATSYYEADGLGSVTSLSNAAGAVAQTYTFDSFGNQIASSGSLTNPFRYNGREFDAESGLYFYRARYFDPAAGRFLSEDPLGINGEDVNYYRFVGNSPTLYIDPLGLFSFTYSVKYHDDGWYGLMKGTTNVTLPPTLTSKCSSDCDGKSKLTFDVTFKIYVDAGNGWQTRHEQGHVQILQNYFNARTEYYHNHYEGTYPSAAACEAAAKNLRDSIMNDLQKDYKAVDALQDAHDDYLQNGWNWLKSLF